MSITVACPGCGRKYAATDKHAGRNISCKQCGGSIPVPAQSPPPPSGPLLRYACDQCGTPYAISPEHAGKKTICSKCGLKFRIPGGGSPSTVSTKSASAPASSKPATVAVPARESPPPIDLDIYGLDEEPVALLPRSAGSAAEASASNRAANEADIPPPPRMKAYTPLSEGKKKQIAKRAAKLERMKPSNATIGVSFGAVLAVSSGGGGGGVPCEGAACSAGVGACCG